MFHVNLLKLQNDGSQKVIAVCRLKGDGTVDFQGESVLIERLKNKGIRDYTNRDKKVTYFSDGRHFLENLKYNFTSAYLNATDILS